MSQTDDPTDTFPILSDHADIRWASRSDHPEIGLMQAWDESVTVDLPSNCPYGPHATLHDPGNVVLIYAEAREDHTDWVVKTVLHAELLGTSASIVDHHLETCDCCGYRYDPKADDGECHWCEAGYGVTSDAETAEMAEAVR